MPVDTLIFNGRVACSNKIRKTSIAFDDGTIVAIGDRASLPGAETTINAENNIVMPGVVDPHVHIDEVPENRAGTYESETRAAARGGVTTIIDFAWQGGNRRILEEKTLLDGIENKKQKQDQSYIDFGVHGVLLREKQETLEELQAAVDAGVSSFKMFMSNYEIGVSNGFINKAFERISELNAVAALHTEDPSVCDELLKQAKEQNRGDPIYYPETRPDYSESMAINDVLQMASDKGVKYYGVHTTCKKSAEELESYQKNRSKIRAETCTHYTALDDSVYEELGTYPLIAPPIRKQQDIESIFNHLRSGTISVVSTDHSAYTDDSKHVENWWDSPFGANSLQRSLSVFHHEAVVKRDFSYPFLIDVMCQAPAQTFGMPNKGSLEPGTDADVVVFNPDKQYTITAEDNESAAGFSIYDGKDVSGQVEKTFVRGELIFDDDQIVGESGHGEFLEREIPDWSA